MSFLSRLFGSQGGASAPKDVESELGKLEAEAENARPGYVGSAYNRAGDLALRDQQEGRALGYYGRSIDAFLEDAQREAARGVANKIIRVRPTAVRTLCTLTWLDLAARHQATALLHLRDYGSAAREAGEQARAATQIYKMARLADAAEFLDAAADALDGLDFGNRAKEVRSWVKAGAPEAVEEEDALADACLRAAVASNDPNAAMLDDDVTVPEGDSEADVESESEDSESAEAEPEDQAEPDSDASVPTPSEAEPAKEGQGGTRKRRNKKNKRKR